MSEIVDLDIHRHRPTEPVSSAPEREEKETIVVIVSSPDFAEWRKRTIPPVGENKNRHPVNGWPLYDLERAVKRVLRYMRETHPTLAQDEMLIHFMEEDHRPYCRQPDLESINDILALYHVDGVLPYWLGARLIAFVGTREAP